MPDTTFNTFENEYAQAAALDRERIMDQRKQAAVGEEKQEKSLKTRVKGALAKMGKDDDGSEEERGFAATMSKSVKLTTGWGLRWSWYALIPSWGLSLIVLNLFAFLGLIFHGAFPRVGEEWKTINPFVHPVIEKMAFWLVNAVLILLIFILYSMFFGDVQDPNRIYNVPMGQG